MAIWRGAARRLLAQSRYAALLVSLHGTSLYERIDPDAYPPEVAAAIRDYVAGEQALQASLSAGLDAAEVDRNRRLLLALDRFSLALCHGRATTLEELGAPIAVAPAPEARRRGGARRPRGAAGDGDRAPGRSRRGRSRRSGWSSAARRAASRVRSRDAGAARAALAAAPWVPLRWELRAG